MRRTLLLLAVPLLAAALVLSSANTASAQVGVQFTIQPQTEFPDGLRFDITLDAPVEIVEARLRFRVLGEQVSRNAPLEFDPASRVTTSLLVRTDTAARYIPPGAEIEYSVEATDAAGNVIASEPERTIFLDPRFEWSRIDAPGVYLLHYGGQEGRARRALEAAQEALERMVLGEPATEPPW